MSKEQLHKQMDEVQAMISKFVEVCEVYQDPNSTEEDILATYQKSFENSPARIQRQLEKVQHSSTEQYKRNREKRANAAKKKR